MWLQKSSNFDMNEEDLENPVFPNVEFNSLQYALKITQVLLYSKSWLGICFKDIV